MCIYSYMQTKVEENRYMEKNTQISRRFIFWGKKVVLQCLETEKNSSARVAP